MRLTIIFTSKSHSIRVISGLIVQSHKYGFGDVFFGGRTDVGMCSAYFSNTLSIVQSANSTALYRTCKHIVTSHSHVELPIIIDGNKL